MILIVVDDYDGDTGNFVLNIQTVTTQCSNDEAGNIQTAIRPKPPKRPNPSLSTEPKEGF